MTMENKIQKKISETISMIASNVKVEMVETLRKSLNKTMVKVIRCQRAHINK